MATNIRELNAFRTAVTTRLIERAPTKLGRTAIMKLMYFLQTLRGVPLGYTFRLYTYGPYDGQVLDDLRMAESIGAVNCKAFEWQGGIGYELEPGPKAGYIVKEVQPLIAAHDDAMDAVLDQFARRSASDLEIASTIVFVDRSVRAASKRTKEKLADQVHEVKPHHQRARIEEQIEVLRQMNLLVSVN